MSEAPLFLRARPWQTLIQLSESLVTTCKFQRLQESGLDQLSESLVTTRKFQRLQQSGLDPHNLQCLR